MVIGGASGNEAYSYNDRHFREACKVILGGEVGALSDYEEWLLTLKQPQGCAKSSVSGKGLVLASPDYAPSARFVALGEESSLTAKPFNINDIKDMDSLLSAATERFAYSGNLVFGNSQFVQESSDVSDSFYVYRSARVSGCKSIACSTIVKDSNYLFGCNVASKDEYCMRCHQFTFDARCFEASLTTSSSDCYYTYDCVGCRDAIFSFGQRNGANIIGNLALPKEKYLQLKGELLTQMREELAAKKKLPSLADIFSTAAKEKAEITPDIRKCARKFERKTSRAPVQKAFDATAKLVLGKEAGDVASCREWLLGHNIRVRRAKSALGSGEVPVASYENLKALPDSRYVNLDEAKGLAGKLKLDAGSVESLALANAGKLLGKILYIAPQFHEGTILNVGGSPIIMSSSDCEEVHGCIYMKRSAYSTWGRDSEYLFGCAFCYDSGFSIKCYNSFRIRNCFEVDSARLSTGCYFCHNVENVHDAIFCSNVKNLRYAVCNVEVGKEQFERVKKLLLESVLAELKKSHDCPLGIYDLA